MPIPRRPIEKTTQVQVFKRDRWLCRWCLRPVIFPPAMKFLEQFLRSRGIAAPLAYYQTNWRRDAAPLLDELGASVDHVEAHSRGGSSQIDNLATICAKCNARKGALPVSEHLKRNPSKKVKGMYGEPVHWDGLSTLFLALASENPSAATVTEKQWIAALKDLSTSDAP
jgi:5-methylcytosine-specific restriction endonuclease McrA